MTNKMHKGLFLFVSICYVLVIRCQRGREKKKTGWEERQVRKNINLEKNKTAICPSTLRLKSLKKQRAILFSFKKK